jgi:L-2-hydroxyglutarate oxidase LhgO
VRSGGEEEVVEAALVVNAAGLYADRVARLALPAANGTLPAQEWVKGSYFSIRPGSRVRAERLIYPCPHPDLRGLGTHLTLDLAGGQRLGPDVERIPAPVEDYRVDADRAASFYEAARRFLPALAAEDLAPAYSGLRPQAVVAAGFRDFYVAREDRREVPPLVNLIGIESPGLTCALSIAEHVAALAAE